MWSPLDSQALPRFASFNSVTGREAPSKGLPRNLVSRRLDAVQAVGRILAREEDDVFLGRRPAGVRDVGGNVDYRAGFGLDLRFPDPCPKRALQNVDPLLVRVRMRLCAGAGRHPHQRDDHAVTLDAGAVGGRIVGAAEDVVYRGEIEHVFTVARALGTRGPRHLLRHFSSPSLPAALSSTERVSSGKRPRLVAARAEQRARSPAENGR